MITKENEKLRSRIFNWKFESALHYLNGESDEVQKLIKSLAVVFGDCGWIDGAMENIVGTCVWTLLRGEEDE